MSKRKDRKASSRRREQRRAERSRRDRGPSGKVSRTAGVALSFDVAGLRQRPLRSIPHELARLIAADPLRALGHDPFPRDPKEIVGPLPGAISKVSRELTYASAVLRSFGRRLQEFEQLRQEFEIAFLTGHYSNARNALTSISGTFGASLWHIHARLLLAEYELGFAANRETLRELTPPNKGLPALFAHYFSKRVERQLSYPSYETSFEHDFRTLQKDRPTQDALAWIRFRLNPPSATSPSTLAYALWRDLSLPVIDIFHGFTRIARALAAEPTEHSSLSEAISRIGERLDSPLLRPLGAYLHPAATPSSALPPELLAALDAYTAGNYAGAVDLAHDLLKKQPHALDLYELAVTASIHAGRELANPFAPQTVAHELYETMGAILRRTERSQEAVQHLLKLSCVLDGLHSGAQVLALAHTYRTPVQRTTGDRLSHLATPHLSPRFSRLYSRQSAAHAYLARLSQSRPESPSIQLFSHLLGRAGYETMPPVPRHRSLKYNAEALLLAGKPAEAAAVYANLLDESADNPLLCETAVLGLLEAHLAAGHLREAAMTFLKHFFAAPRLLTFFRREQLVEAHEAAKAPFDTIAWPILYWLKYSDEPHSRNRSRIYAAYASFLDAIGFERPSQIQREVLVHDERDAYIFFLRHVCAPEVMDFSPVFSSTEELENERVAICQLLSDADARNSEAYAREISHLAQAAMIRRAIQYLDESKIHIDVAGIARSLDASFRERYRRYVILSSLTQELRETLRLEGVALKPDENMVVVSDATVEQFKELFDVIKTRFLSSNEYGLDSYLSVRIRHGTLSGQIRSLFEREQLITRKSKGDGVYDWNAFWTESVFQQFGPPVVVAANERLRDFSRRIDDIIDRVKNQWIQIRGPEKREGLFDFDFTPDEVQTVYVDALLRQTYDGFLEEIFKALLVRTEASLLAVRQRIFEELQPALTTALDTLCKEAFAIEDELRHSAFGSAIMRARTSIQNEIETLASWFKAADVKGLVSFDFQLLADTAVFVIRRCFPSVSFACHVLVDSDAKIQGDRFGTFVDVMFILLENAVKHSQSREVRATLSIAGDGREGASITVTNVLGPSVDLPTITEHVRRLNAYSFRSGDELVRSEGGTGYRKLHKLVGHDLERKTAYTISVMLPDERVFSVMVRMSLDGLRHEDTGN